MTERRCWHELTGEGGSKRGGGGKREEEVEEGRPEDHRSLLCISITQRHEYQSEAADLKLRERVGQRRTD